VLNVRFYLQTIHKTKNTKKIIIIKIKKYKDKEKRIHTSVKSQPPKQRNLFNLINRNREEKRNGEEEKRSREKKMNQMGGGGGIYMAIFPTELPMEINCCWWH